MRIFERPHQPANNRILFVVQRAAHVQPLQLSHVRPEFHFMKTPFAQRFAQKAAVHAGGREEYAKKGVPHSPSVTTSL